MKEFFQNGGEVSWPKITLRFELRKEGIINLKFLEEESKRYSIGMKWWD